MIILNRLMRLAPLYYFTVLFFWKFMPLFGGDGPAFFQYDSSTQCSQNWVWHFLFINNLIPWSSPDNCMHWTWYVANDMQFFLLLPMLSTLYYSKRKVFYIAMGTIAILSLIFQMSVILAHKLSISYFTYRDEYWSIYYVKPYARICPYLLGVLSGCVYFTYKYDQPENQRLALTL